MGSKQHAGAKSQALATLIPGEFKKEAGKFCPHAGVVSRGSGMFQEQGRILLLSRLRMASLLLALASLAFLIRGLWLGEFDDSHGQEMLFLDSILTGILFAVSGVLWWKPSLCLWRLRICEAITFGAPAAFFYLVAFL